MTPTPDPYECEIIFENAMQYASGLSLACSEYQDSQIRKYYDMVGEDCVSEEMLLIKNPNFPSTEIKDYEPYDAETGIVNPFFYLVARSFSAGYPATCYGFGLFITRFENSPPRMQIVSILDQKAYQNFSRQLRKLGSCDNSEN